MQLITALSLALATTALANPLLKRAACTSDSCAAAVTGSGALGDAKLRSSHCASFLITTVTPEATTVTVTATGEESVWGDWKREKVTVCPNEVPNYASACNTAAYSSACACFGISGDSTTTIDRATVTKTVYVDGGASTCTAKTVTITPSFCPTTSASTSTTTSVETSTSTTTSVETSTTTVTTSAAFCPTTSASTTTVTTTTTTTSTTTSAAATCLTSDDAQYLVDSFTNFLTNTGANFDTDLADTVLADDFSDVSESIKYLLGLDTSTPFYATKADFIAGQTNGFPTPIAADRIYFNCNSVSFYYHFLGYDRSIAGINILETNAAKQIVTNYAEFNSLAFSDAIAAAQAAAANSSKKRSQPSLFRPNY